MTKPRRALRNRSRTTAPRRASRPRLEFLEDRAVPATFQVWTPADSGEGSLRQAIYDASLNAESDIIEFNGDLGDQTITLTTSSYPGYSRSALVIQGDNVTIDGAAAPGLTISGGGALRLFGVSTTGELTLRNITLADGLARGGDGGDGEWGGGGGAGLGGAVYVFGGKLTVENATLTGNIARGGDGGYGDILNANGAGGGGGTGGDGVSGVGGPDGAGGSADSFGPGPAGDSGMGAGGSAESPAQFGGGGSAGDDGQFGGGGGGEYFDAGGSVYGGGQAGVGGGGGAGLGGAIFNYGGIVNIINSTLAGNQAVGGAGGGSADESMDGGPPGQAGAGLGAAVFNLDGTLNVLNSTLVGNPGETGLHSIALFDSTSVALNNAILWTSPGDGTVNDFVSDDLTAMGASTSGVGNLIGSQVGFDGTVVSSADPLLGPLADNGGPTPTMLPGVSSPALAAGNVVVAQDALLTTDQRGLPRFDGSSIDIGSVQVASTSAPAITSAGSSTFNVDSSGTFTITTTGSPTASLSYTGTLPAGVTFTDNGDGTATISGIPASGTVGTYAITITAANGESPDATQAFTLDIDPAFEAPEFTSSASTTFTVGQAGTFTVTTSGWPQPHIALDGGDFPAGVTMVDNGDGTATVSGTPTVAGVYNILLWAYGGTSPDGFQSFVMTVDQAPSITSADSATFEVGSAGTFTITTTGWPDPQIAYFGGSLPTGLTFTDNGDGTATISGTVAAGQGGVYELSLEAWNGVGAYATQDFTLIVNEDWAFTSSASTTFTVGQAGTFTVTTSGWPQPNIAIDGGAFPPGVTMVDNGDGTATVSGTPTAAGVYNILLWAYNGDFPELSAFQNFTLTVDQAPSITSANSSTFYVGYSGSFTITTTGYPAPELAVLAGSLPTGLSFVDNGDGTATLSGTAAAGQGGVYSLTFSASNGIGADASQGFTLTLDEAPSFTSADLATFQVGSAGSFTITTMGWPIPAISLDEGSLPDGVTLVDNGDGTATLSGIPASGEAGVYVLTLLAFDGIEMDATQTFTLTIEQADSAPEITSPSSTTFTIGSAGSFTITTTGWPYPAISILGALPTGLSFVDNGDGTATISGTPTDAAWSDLPILITADNGVVGEMAYATQYLDINLNPALTILPATMPTPAAGANFELQIIPGGGSGEGYVLSAPYLPPGLNLVQDEESGDWWLWGTPEDGEWPVEFDLTLTDATGASTTIPYIMGLNPALAISPAYLPEGVVSNEFTFQLTASGGSGEGYVFWAYEGLPPGLTLSESGLIEGTPTSTGIYNIWIGLGDDQGSWIDVEYSITIFEAVEIAPATIPATAAGSSYNVTFTASGGFSEGSYDYTAEGLPTGLTLDPDGVLHGSVATPGTYVFEVFATAAFVGHGSRSYTLVVNPALTMGPVDMPSPSLDTYFEVFLTSAGGSGEGYVFSSEALPPGLELYQYEDGRWSIWGEAQDGEWPYEFELTLTDSTGASTTSSFTMGVFPPLVILPDYVAIGTVGNAYSFQFTAGGGSGEGNVFWVWDYGPDEYILPPGLSLTEDGLLQGIPTVAGTYEFEIDLRDDQGSETWAMFTLVVNPALTISPTTLPVATATNGYSVQLEGEGGSWEGYEFSAEGLPDGLSIDEDGLITGTPTTPGTYTFVVTLTDANEATGTQSYTLVVNTAISISPATLPAATVGSGYSEQLTAAGGSGEGYVFNFVDVTPEGLTLSPSGLLTGTIVSTAGSPIEFLIQVTDSNGARTTRAYSLAVQAAGSTTSLAGPAGPVAYGSPATFVASVSAIDGLPAPTGTVSFYDGEILIGSVPLAGGVASFTTSSLQPGLLAIRAVYSGDSVYAGGMSPVVMQSVRVGSTTTVTKQTQGATFGEAVRFIAAVQSTVDPYLPGGLVGFYDGETLLGTALLAADGTATFETTALGAGSHSIKAIYAGNVYFAPSASSPISVDVAKNAAITGTVSADPSQVYYGQASTLTATFTALSAGLNMSGTVSFYQDGTLVGTAPLAPASIANASIATPVSTVVGTATLPGVVLAVGNHAITAVYSGDSNYATATSAAAAQVIVAPVGTSTNLVASPGGDGTTLLTATVTTTTPGDPTIAGTVTFFDGDNALATVAVVNGVASYNVGTLSQGAHVFRAVYSGGGAGDASSSSAAVTVAASGPQVTGLSRYGFHASPTSIVLTFNGALDPATAQNPANYRIVQVGRGNRIVPIVSASYDAATNTVTLTPSQRLNLHWTYRLTVNGKLPTGVAGANGVPLDGAGANQPGTDFVANITWKNLTAPGSEPAVTFSQGVERSTSSPFNRYVNAVTARYRGAAARVLVAPRLAARALFLRGR